jgi:uncharacterized protein
MRYCKKDFYWIVFIVFIIICFVLVKNINGGKPNSILNPEVRHMGSPICLTSGECVHFVKIAGQNVKVELALTPKEQEKGLSGRENLADDAGMLFVFKNPGKYSFWMKDMNFPIDIIWLNENFKVIYIKKNAEPSSYPDSFGSGVDSKYVLEVNSGFSEKNNLKEGDLVKFLP